MQIILERKIHNATSTEGNLYVNGKWFCHTIEDVVRAKPGEWNKKVKVYGKTAIPYGTYPILVTYSPKFKRQLTLIDKVPDFLGIRVHSGVNENSSAGCVLVSYKDDDGPDKKKNRLVKENAAMDDLCKLIQEAQKKEKCFIDIVDRKEDSKFW